MQRAVLQLVAALAAKGVPVTAADAPGEPGAPGRIAATRGGMQVHVSPHALFYQPCGLRAPADVVAADQDEVKAYIDALVTAGAAGSAASAATPVEVAAAVAKLEAGLRYGALTCEEYRDAATLDARLAALAACVLRNDAKEWTSAQAGKRARQISDLMGSLLLNSLTQEHADFVVQKVEQLVAQYGAIGVDSRGPHHYINTSTLCIKGMSQGDASQRYRDTFRRIWRLLLPRITEPDCQNVTNWTTALQEAALHGCEEGARDLLQHGADPHARTRAGGAEPSATPLMLAACKGHLGVVRELLRQPSVVAAVDDVDGRSFTAAELAAAAGHCDVVMALRAAGASVCAPPTPGHPINAVLVAAGWAQPEVLQALLTGPQAATKAQLDQAAVGANLWVAVSDIKREMRAGDLPLHTAAQAGSPACVRLLLQAGVAVDAPTARGETALTIACRMGARTKETRDSYDAVIRRLLEGGANANAIGSTGKPLLHEAAWLGYGEAIRALITAGGATIHAQDARGVQPLGYAAGRGSREAVLALLELGAQPDGILPDGTVPPYTPLHIAAECGYVGVTELLLKHGADPRILSQDGRTAADVAELMGHRQLAAALQQAAQAMIAAGKPAPPVWAGAPASDAGMAGEDGAEDGAGGGGGAGDLSPTPTGASQKSGGGKGLLRGGHDGGHDEEESGGDEDFRGAASGTGTGEETPASRAEAMRGLRAQLAETVQQLRQLGSQPEGAAQHTLARCRAEADAASTALQQAVQAAAQAVGGGGNLLAVVPIAAKLDATNVALNSATLQAALEDERNRERAAKLKSLGEKQARLQREVDALVFAARVRFLQESEGLTEEEATAQAKSAAAAGGAASGAGAVPSAGTKRLRGEGAGGDDEDDT